MDEFQTITIIRTVICNFSLEIAHNRKPLRGKDSRSVDEQYEGKSVRQAWLWASTPPTFDKIAV